MQISIPDTLKPWLDEQARRNGCHNADEFVADLLLRQQKQTADEDSRDYGAPAQVSVGTRADLEAKLLESLDSGPATPMTAEDWASIRREAQERTARRGLR